MMRAIAVLAIAAIVLLSARGIVRAGGHVYQNGVDGGVGPAISVGTAGVSVLVPARPGANRYDLGFQCTVAVNVAWGGLSGSATAANPPPSATTGIPVAANTWWENPVVGELIAHFSADNWDRELDVISQSGSGVCVTYEATLN
jgi:hypothetical protein